MLLAFAMLQYTQQNYSFMQGVWSRALGLPIERPKSFTMEALEKKVGAK